MMTIKKLEKLFEKTIHSDLKGELYLTVEHYDVDTDKGIVVFLDKDFESIYECTPKMLQHIYWYFENPKKNYKKAISSNHEYDRALAIIDQLTGKRTLDDWKQDDSEIVKTFYELRKKYQS